jgi:hypothetical protein
MSSSIAFGFRRRAVPLTPTEAHERSIKRRVGLAWGLIVINVLPYGGSVIHIPSLVGKLITQGALLAGLLVALSVNRRIIVRPNVFLCLVSLIAIEAMVLTLQPQALSTVYRCFRLVAFVVALWLLTPWWGRRDLLLVRCYLVSLWVVLGSVFLGLLVAPGTAMTGGRLTGALWYIAATQIAHYAAVTIGLMVVLWLGGKTRGWPTLLVVVPAVAILLLTHTRTALVALVAGILVAGLSLIVAKARVRKFFVTAGLAVSIAITTLSSVITAFLVRGEGSHGLTTLTGRTEVWGPLLAFPRDKWQEILGFGLSNVTFNGLPIDSNWLAAYQTQGLFGVVICAVILLFLLVKAYFQPRGLERALALFLVTYCVVASFTEVGFIDASTYLLDLFLAASLLVPSAARGRAREE